MNLCCEITNQCINQLTEVANIFGWEEEAKKILQVHDLQTLFLKDKICSRCFEFAKDKDTIFSVLRGM